ncbi:MAG: polymer-forming cytoskeletal protein, partial [Rhodospirillales bacterium]|nr:polymer-forming cytoskeletal protein [Rhodospirillales bacterium]
LAGKADANVVAEDGAELLPGATLTGQLFTSQLHVVDGATFQGDVFIGANAMEQAGEALRDQPIETQAPVFNEQTAPQQQSEEKSNVSTVPGSVQSVLHRRRPKVLVPQGAGNGNGNGHS